jgi:hypothetical protein
MNKKLNRGWAILVLGLFVLGSCSVRNSGGEIQATTQQDEFYSATLNDKPLEPSATPFVITPINTPYQKSVAEEKYLGLLSTNGGCVLPCFWGILPGKSTTYDLVDSFTALKEISGLSSYYSDGGFSIFHYIEEGYDLSTYVSYISTDAQTMRIDHLYVIIREYDEATLSISYGHVYASEPFNQRINPYNVSSVLTKMGEPEMVLISVKEFSGDTEDSIYRELGLILVYPDEGLFLHYTVPGIKEDQFILGCTAVANVEMELYPVGNREMFGQQLSRTEWAGFWPPSATPQPSWLPIDQATYMTIDEFYELFHNDPDACISTPADLWN